MQNFGKYLASLSDSEILTGRELESVLLAILEQNGKGLTLDMASAGSIRRSNTMKGTYIVSVSVAMGLKVDSKPSTKKKSKKGTAKERGTNSSLKAVKSVKGVRSKSR